MMNVCLKRWTLSILIPALIVLTACAVFLYHSSTLYVSRAPQVEAKSALAAILSAEQEQFRLTNKYTSSIDVVSYVPERNKRNYTIGIIPSCEANGSAEDKKDIGQSFYWAHNNRFLAKNMNYKNEMRVIIDKYKHLCKSAKEGFTAIAIGKISKRPGYDVWIVDESYKIKNVERQKETQATLITEKVLYFAASIL